MKRVLHDMQPAPAGFEWVRLDAEASLLLPADVAASRAQNLQRRRDAEDERRREELRRQQEERTAQADRASKAGAARARLHRKAVRLEPRPGWHRVLSKLADTARELDNPKSVERSADRDVNQWRRRILERLMELGPDRRIAMPPNWRTAVAELEAALPHFGAPIRALRHALALAEATGTAPRITPQLLLGPPGVGKTFYSHRVAELFGSPHASIAFDQPSAGSQLRGSDKYWSNTEPGVLFNFICLGEFANPVILLDEMDKACAASTSRELDPLTQLHGALEHETARRLIDVSVDVEFDASLAVYVGTANSLRGIGSPIVSRMQVFVVEPPSKWEAIDIAASISQSVVRRLRLEGQISFERQALYLLAHLTPRHMVRAAERSLASAVAAGRRQVSEVDLWTELSGAAESRHH